MKIMTREDFDAGKVAAELIDVMVRSCSREFSARRASPRSGTETEADRETGSHFNQSGADARLQRRVWFTRLVELSPDIARPSRIL